MTGQKLEKYLRNEIVVGRIPAGSRLPSERTLAQEFGISRPMVREILRGLSDQGLVETHSARGSFVLAADSANGAKGLELLYRRRKATVRELTDARLMMETHAARLAALHATELEIRAMRGCLDEFAGASDLLEEAQLDLAFHALIIKASHNTVIDITYASITTLVFELMLRSLSDRKVKRLGAPLHDEIWSAIRDHRPDDAAAAIAEHLTLAQHLYGDDYDRSVDDLAQRELERQVGSRAQLEQVLAEVSRRHSEFMAAQVRASMTATNLSAGSALE